MAPAPAPTRVSRPTPIAKPTKIRYFKGKAPSALPDSDDDSDDDDGAAELPKPQIDKSVVAGGAGRIIPEGGGMKVALRDVKVEGGRVLLGGKVEGPVDDESEEDETDEEEEEDVRVKPVGIPAIKPPGDESSEYETDSEEESEEEKKPAFRPVFVKKDARGMTQEMIIAQAEEKVRLEQEMEVQRKIDSKELAGETIRRELLEKEALTTQPDVDDTDHLDPAAEFEAWRLRELSRLLRDKQSEAERDLEKEEIERRRAMPEEQRLKEDMEYADGTRAKEKGQMGFLQKYYHKGAFHQDDDLLTRDYTGATAGAVDMSNLPKIMQVRNFGKMSRTKYTHLTDQDTSGGGWGTAARQTSTGVPGQQQQQGCWNCGGPHMRADCPNANPNDPMGMAGGGIGTSANTAALGFGSGSGGGSGLQRSWGGDNKDNGEGGSRYRQEGKDRRFDEERASHKESREEPKRTRDPDRDDSHRDGSGDREHKRSREDGRHRDSRHDDGGSERRKDDRERDDRGSSRHDRHKSGDDERDGRRERHRSRSRSPRRERHRERDRDDRRHRDEKR